MHQLLQLFLPFLAFWELFALAANTARADYAVLQSGARLHITGYEQTGDKVRLTVEGGVVEIPASELASVEPEDTFARFRPLRLC